MTSTAGNPSSPLPADDATSWAIEDHHEVSTSDGTLHAATCGPLTGTPVLLLHGMSSSSQDWIERGMATGLTNARRSWIAMDTRGHGASLKLHDPARHQLPRLLDDIRAVLDALDVDHADLVGYSLGSHLAGEFAVAYPERVRALVIGGFDGPLGASLLPKGIEQRVRSRLERGTALPTLESERIWAFVNEPGNDPAALIACWEGAMQSIRARSVRPALVGYPGPLLVCAGRNDHLAQNIDALASLTQQGVARRLGDHDHFEAFESEEFATAVLEFLEPFPRDA